MNPNLTCPYCGEVYFTLAKDMPGKREKIDAAFSDHLDACASYTDYEMEQGKIEAKGGRY